MLTKGNRGYKQLHELGRIVSLYSDENKENLEKAVNVFNDLLSEKEGYTILPIVRYYDKNGLTMGLSTMN